MWIPKLCQTLSAKAFDEEACFVQLCSTLTPFHLSNTTDTRYPPHTTPNFTPSPPHAPASHQHEPEQQHTAGVAVKPDPVDVNVAAGPVVEVPMTVAAVSVSVSVSTAAHATVSSVAHEEASEAASSKVAPPRERELQQSPLRETVDVDGLVFSLSDR